MDRSWGEAEGAVTPAGHREGIGVVGRPLIVLIATACAVAIGAAGAAASQARSGARYDGIGQVLHFSPPQGQERSACYSPSCALADVNFDIRLDVARGGRRMKVLVSGLAGACGDTLGRYILPAPASTVIRRDGTFRLVLRDGSPQYLMVTGQFLAHRRVRGTLRYLACSADGVWTAYVRPLHPRTRQFIGTTGEGTPMMLERTVEPIPYVTRVYFAPLQFAPSPANCAAMPLGPLFLGPSALPLHHDSFATNGGGDAAAFTISGQFDSNTSVSGTIQYDVQETCFTGKVPWTAYPVPGGPS